MFSPNDAPSRGDVEGLVSTALKRMYPPPGGPVPYEAPVATAGRRRVLRARPAVAVGTAAATIAAVAIGVVAVLGHSDPNGTQQALADSGSPSPSQTANSSTSPAPAPGWVAACFQTPGVMSDADRAYVGLTESEALTLAQRRGQQLVLVGAGGACNTMDDLVARRAPVAVAFDRGSPNDGPSKDAHIVFATSDHAARYQGWGLG